MGGAFDNDRLWGQIPVPLKATMTGEGPTITLEQGDDLEAIVPECVRLRLLLDQWVVGDVIKVYWDGEERTDVRREYHLAEDAAGQPDGRPRSTMSARRRGSFSTSIRPRRRRGSTRSK